MRIILELFNNTKLEADISEKRIKLRATKIHHYAGDWRGFSVFKEGTMVFSKNGEILAKNTWNSPIYDEHYEIIVGTIIKNNPNIHKLTRELEKLEIVNKVVEIQTV